MYMSVCSDITKVIHPCKLYPIKNVLSSKTGIYREVQLSFLFGFALKRKLSPHVEAIVPQCMF